MQGIPPTDLQSPDPVDDRRAYRRFLLNLDGTIDVAGRQLPCEIRDFCAGGMFLVFAPGGAQALSGGREITVRCTIQSGNSPRNLRFQARVVRLTTDAAGIAFIEPDAGDLHEMLNFAAGRQQSASAPLAEGPAVLDPAAARRLIERCNELMNASLGPLLKSVMDVISRRLFEASRSTKLVSEQNAYFDATETLRTSEDRLLGSFQKAMANHLQNYASSEDTQKTWSDVSQSSLSLVDDEALENWIAVSDITNHVENQHKELLAGLERRLSVVMNIQVTRDNNPYSPRIVSEAFQELIADLNWPAHVNKIAYRSFREIFTDQAGLLYGQLNELLINQGILPKLKIYKVAKQPQSAASAAKVAEAPVAEVPPATSTQPAATPPPPVASLPTRAAGETVQPDLYQVVRELRDLYKGMQLRPTLDGRPPEAPPPPPSGPAYKKEELLEALTRLQVAQVNAGDGVADVRARLKDVLAEAGAAQPRHVSEHDDNVLDVADNLFKAMLQDPMVADGVKQWLQRLELPLMRLALQDNSLFMDKSHVARQVINKIAQLEFYGGGPNSIQTKVDKMIDKVVKEYESDTSVFNATLKQLDRLVQTQDRAFAENLKDVVKACEQERPQPEAVTDVAELDDTEHARWVKRARRLNEGDWLLLKDAAKKPKRVQLAWVSEDHQIFVLVNLLGQRERTLDIDTLARLLADGSAVPLAEAGDPAMDRAQYTMLQGLHDQLLFHSTHDNMTGLINRHEFENVLQRALAAAKREDSRHVLCFIDVDKFRAINTTCGYAAGDQLLKLLAVLITTQLEGQGTLARLGSDEFGLLLEDCALEDALDIAEKLIESAGQFRFEWDDKRMSISLSIGLVPFNARSDSVAQMWQSAESSCRVAKDSGGGRLHVYHSGHARQSHQDMMMKWIGKIDRILENDQLFLRCQRIMPILSDNGELPRFEILLGIRDDNGEVHSPQEFIAAAEWYHRMPAVDRWVTRNALQWMARNQALLERVEGFAINLSGQSLTDDGFADFIIGELERTGVPRSKVCFEVTETVGISNLSDAAVFIQQIKDTGCKFSLDDFGSGMSSYSYLKNLPVDVLKIDGSFVKNMDNNTSDYAVVKSVCEVAHFMDKKVVAEYVESSAILDLLRSIGVDYAQGYFIEEPVILENLAVA